ncbi:MAG: NAD(P)-dependent alcohol dehydrogenase [Marmoricola sp.]
MRAVVQDRYGSVDHLTVRDIETPTVEDDEVLVRVHAASVHPDVWHVVTGHPKVLRLMGSGLRRPRSRVPGTDVAGTVVSVGAAVSRLKAGDEVFGETLRGFQWHNGGAYAEYVAAPADNLVPKPDTITFEQAACLPTAGLIALFNLPKGERLRPGHRVLVNGAGGGVGSIAAQLAKANGATVTGVDHPDKLEMIRSLGVDEVIDYTREDFTQGGERYDVVFDIPGNHSLSECRRVLTPDGSYVWIGHDGFDRSQGRLLGGMHRAIGLMALTPFVRQLPSTGFTMAPKLDSMTTLRELVEAGHLTAVVDTTYPLEQVAAAIHHLERGDAQGRIVITP